MYKINLDALRQVKEAYEKAGNTLEEQREAVQAALGQITDGTWNGEDAETFKEELGSYLETVYQDDIESMRKLASILDWGLDMAGSLKLYCERFPDVIKGGTIGMLGDSRGVSGILYCDPDQVDRAVKASQDASESAARVSRLADEIDELLAGLKTINFGTAETDAIRASCKRIQNLEEYGAVLHTYKENVELLDGELAKQLADYVPEGIELAGGRFRSTPEGRLAADQMTGTYLKEERNAQLEKAEAILEKDADSWTEEEAAFVAEIWAACIEEQDTEGVERLLEKLSCTEYGEEVTYIAGIGLDAAVRMGKKVPVIMYFDQEKSDVLLKHMDPFAQGEAYYTLSRISGFCEELQIDAKDRGKETFTIEAGRADGKMIIRITADTPVLFDKESNKLTVLDMNAEVSTEGMQVLRGLGFSDEQIVTFLRTAYTDRDVEFIGTLSRADSVDEYAEVFLTDPGQLSAYMRTGLNVYADILFQNGMTYEEDGTITAMDFGRLQNFVNGLLGSYRVEQEYRFQQTEEGREGGWQEKEISFRREYLELLAGEAELELEMISGLIFVSYADKERVKQLIPAFCMEADMCALYQVLLYKSNELEEEDNYPEGAHYFQIDKLELDGNTDKTVLRNNLENTCFSFILQKEPGIFIWNWPEEEIRIERIPPVECEGIKVIADFHEAEKAKKWAIPKAIWKVISSAAGAANPYVGIVIGAGEAAVDAKELGTTAKGAGNMMTESSQGRAAVAAGAAAYSSIWDIYQSYQAAEEAEEAILGSVLYDGIMIDQGDGILIQRGQYTINTVLRYAYLCNEGISFMSEKEIDLQEEIKENGNLDIKKMDQTCFKELSEQEKLDRLSLVWYGKPISEECSLTLADLSPEEIRVCMNVLGKNNREVDRVGWYAKLADYDVLKEIYDEE